MTKTQFEEWQSLREQDREAYGNFFKYQEMALKMNENTAIREWERMGEEDRKSFGSVDNYVEVITRAKERSNESRQKADEAQRKVVELKEKIITMSRQNYLDLQKLDAEAQEKKRSFWHKVILVKNNISLKRCR